MGSNCVFRLEEGKGVRISVKPWVLHFAARGSRHREQDIHCPMDHWESLPVLWVHPEVLALARCDQITESQDGLGWGGP